MTRTILHGLVLGAVMLVVTCLGLGTLVLGTSVVWGVHQSPGGDKMLAVVVCLALMSGVILSLIDKHHADRKRDNDT